MTDDTEQFNAAMQYAEQYAIKNGITFIAVYNKGDDSGAAANVAPEEITTVINQLTILQYNMKNGTPNNRKDTCN